MPAVLVLAMRPGAEPAPDLDRASGGVRTLERFLRGVERRALLIAELALGDREDALEAVQEAMLGFVRRYAGKPAEEWQPLFHRVLDSRIRDALRRRRVRWRWRQFFGHDDHEADALDAVPDVAEPGPGQRLHDANTRAALAAALGALPLRQRQAFVLRIWEGLDVADTAIAMRCSEGSVKTHLSRALGALRRRLEDYR